MVERTYIAIDLKSFYASSECVELGFDPLRTHLVVADESRTDKTICLAVSPSLKSFGIPGRPRLFEVVQKIGQVNALRRNSAPGRTFTGKSHDYTELRGHPELEVDYIVAPPQMAFYMETSAAIYNIYLKYVAPEDIHPYSIDEVFIDATNYLNLYRLTPEKLAMKIILDILENTGITATAGIGTNLYLAKVAMDIVAKHIPADKNGVRIAQLDELRYRQELWSHRPLTDFWRGGPGHAKKLEKVGLRTMGDVARCSVGKPTEFYNEDLLYKLFGVNAQLLIDHAWGLEPCGMKEINAYFRKHATSLGCPGLSDEDAAKLDRRVQEGYSREKQPYPSYVLSGNTAEIRRLRQRIEEVSRTQSTEYVGWDFPGGRAEADKEDNRLRLYFDEKPSEEQRSKLKCNGFKWAPSVGAWQRQLNDNAIHAAARIDFLRPESGESPTTIQPKRPVKNAPERG